jgi:hypothetical protein
LDPGMFPNLNKPHVVLLGRHRHSKSMEWK